MNKLFLTLLFFPLLSFSQEKNNDSKIDFGFYVLPEMNGLTTANPVGTETARSKFGFSAGLNLEYRLTPKISFRTGLGYGLKNYNHLHEGLIFNSDINPQNGIQTVSRMESSISYSELQLPLLFQYKLNPKVFYTLGLELNTSFADKSERIIYYGNGAIDQLENTTGAILNYAPMLSIGFIVPNSNFIIEPLFKYNIKEYLIPMSNQYNYGLKITYNLGL